MMNRNIIVNCKATLELHRRGLLCGCLSLTAVVLLK